MIFIRKKWQIILAIALMQMVTLDLAIVFFDIPKELNEISNIIGAIALGLSLAPLLNIYDYEEDKKKKKELQKLYNGLSNLKIKLEKQQEQL